MLAVTTGDPVCTVGGWYGGFWPRFYPDLSEIDFDYKRTIEYEELAIYGELTYHFSDTFRLTGGLRWFDNKTTNNSHLGFPLVVGWTPTQFPESTDSDDDILVKLNASWDLPGGQDDLRHLLGRLPAWRCPRRCPTVMRFRHNRSVSRMRLRFASFAADSVTNYEIGIKGHALIIMSYTVSVFQVDWDDPQLNTDDCR